MLKKGPQDMVTITDRGVSFQDPDFQRKPVHLVFSLLQLTSEKTPFICCQPFSYTEHIFSNEENKCSQLLRAH